MIINFDNYRNINFQVEKQVFIRRKTEKDKDMQFSLCTNLQSISQDKGHLYQKLHCDYIWILERIIRTNHPPSLPTGQFWNIRFVLHHTL